MREQCLAAMAGGGEGATWRHAYQVEPWEAGRAGVHAANSCRICLSYPLESSAQAGADSVINDKIALMDKTV